MTTVWTGRYNCGSRANRPFPATRQQKYHRRTER